MSELTEYFEYREGELYWKRSKGSRAVVGQKAGGLSSKDCYKKIRFNKKLKYVHRIIYELHHGKVPEGCVVDHIDGDKTNNHVENLRLCSYSQNAFNSVVHRDSSTGIKNVHYEKSTGKYRVRLSVNKKTVVSVAVADLELAELVAAEARDKYHRIYAKG